MPCAMDEELYMTLSRLNFGLDADCETYHQKKLRRALRKYQTVLLNTGMTLGRSKLLRRAFYLMQILALKLHE